jgi:hypothetical protein
MDSKRDLDGEKRLIRNERARRRRALQYACRRVPIELEREIFSYMKNPDNGRVEVGMKWQKHPTAELFWWAPAVLHIEPWGQLNHGESYITHLAQKLVEYPHGDYLRQCGRRFTPRMQRTIARKAFEKTFANVPSVLQMERMIEVLSPYALEVYARGILNLYGGGWRAGSLSYQIRGFLRLGDWRKELGDQSFDLNKWEQTKEALSLLDTAVLMEP